ncbi:late competence development ComFB family protein [Clostridium algifaecis]|nr:late competence development ComFB family protein [Clostridium algifaecis]
MTKNYMEDVVDTLIPYVLKDYPEACVCPKCIDDIKALTLNNVPQHYVVTEKGEALTKARMLSSQFKADVLKEISISIKTVSKNPRHPLSEKVVSND